LSRNARSEPYPNSPNEGSKRRDNPQGMIYESFIKEAKSREGPDGHRKKKEAMEQLLGGTGHVFLAKNRKESLRRRRSSNSVVTTIGKRKERAGDSTNRIPEKKMARWKDWGKQIFPKQRTSSAETL